MAKSGDQKFYGRKRLPDLIAEHIVGIGFFAIPIATSASLHEQYTAPKWMTLYVVCAFSLASTIFSPNPLRLPSSRALRLLLIGWVLAITLAMGLHPESSYENQILDGLSFVALAFVGYSLLPSHKDTIETLSSYNQWATILVVLLGFSEVFGINPFPRLGRNEFPSSFFGFQNMTAEFVAFSIIIQIHAIFRRDSKKSSMWETAFHWALLVGCLVFLYLLYCRTAWVALGVGIVLLCSDRISDWCRRGSKKMGWVFSALAIAVALILWAPRLVGSMSGLGGGLSATKAGNISIRLARWENTLQMIKDRPLGVGPGNFESAYLGYSRAAKPDPEIREGKLVRSPHNDYLRMLAELGVISGALFVVSLICVALPVSKRWSELRCDSSFRLSVAMLGVVLTLAIFAFPREEAYPFFCAAIFTGLLLSFIDSGKSGPRGTRFCAGIIAMAILVLGGGYILSRSLEALYPRDLQKNEAACRIFPSNWWACFQAARLQLEAGHLDRAKSSAAALLQASDGKNYFALRILADVFQRQEKPESRCSIMAKYDQILVEANMFKSELNSRCANIKTP